MPAQSPLAASFEILPIVDVGGWQAIAAEWDAVLRAVPGYTGLQSFDFLSTWWAHMAGQRTLSILVFRDGAGIVGIAPLQVSQRSIFGKRYAVLALLGMTEDILVPNLLFPAPDAAALRAAFVDYLARYRDGWDLIELDELAADNPLVADLGAFARSTRLIHRRVPFHDCPFLDLAAETAASFQAKCSRKLVKNVRAGERRLREIGEIDVATYSSPADVAEGFRELVAVERNGWKHAAGLGMASDARYEGFYAALLERFARRHGARVMILRVGGQPVAATMGVVYDGIYHSLQIVHDERYARASPGTLLEYYELDSLLQSGGFRRYEFLGGALTNKRRWTAAARATVCVRVGKAEARTRALDAYEFGAKPLAKRVLRRVGLFRPTPKTLADTGG